MRSLTPGKARLIAVAIIVIHGAMVGSSASTNSVTYDEFAHLPAGCAYWKYHDFAIYNLSPPLLRLWAAWPVMLAGADVPPTQSLHDESPTSRHWTYGERFGEANASRYQRLFLLGRCTMIP